MRSITNTEKFYFLTILPIISTIFYVNTNYLQNYIPTDFIYSGILLAYVVYFFSKYKVKNKTHLYLLGFATYAFIMGTYTFLVYNHFEPKVVKICFASLFFAYGYRFVNDSQGLRFLIKGFYYSAVVYAISFIFYNIFDLGYKGVYSVTQLSLGAQGVNTIQIVPFFIFILILTISLKINRKPLQKFIQISLLPIFIGLLILSSKRGALLALIFGLVFYFFNTKRKKKLILIFSITLIPLIYLFNHFSDEITTVYQKRAERMQIIEDERYFEEEGRYIETFLVLNRIIKYPITIVTGNGIGSEFFVFNSRRMIHSDINMIMYSMGIVGLFLYFMIYIMIIKQLNLLSKYFINTNKKVLIDISYLALIYLFFIGLSGSIHLVQYRAFVLLLVGGIIRYLILEMNKNMEAKNIIKMI